MRICGRVRIENAICVSIHFNAYGNGSVWTSTSLRHTTDILLAPVAAREMSAGGHYTRDLSLLLNCNLNGFDFPRNNTGAFCVLRIEQDIVYSPAMKRTVEAYSISIIAFAVFANELGRNIFQFSIIPPQWLWQVTAYGILNQFFDNCIGQRISTIKWQEKAAFAVEINYIQITLNLEFTNAQSVKIHRPDFIKSCFLVFTKI